MEILNNHRSIRKFTEKKINTEIIENIIYSGTRASTTGNMQLYSIIVSTDKEKINKLVPLHFNQPAAKSAPLLLTFVADFNRFVKWCDINKANNGYHNFLSFFTAAIDALLVAQNVCVAAENNGLGICYLGTTIYNANEIIEILNLPKLTFPVTTLAIGYPDEKPQLTDRLPLKSIVHNEYYSDFDDNQIKEFFRSKESLESSKQFVKENKKENLAQVFTDVRYKKSDNEFFSSKMLETIKKQGFEF
ncbi:MAG: nitroreductase family protein [Prolixibacteraceae bacterium]|nr:nitroreductase family protein [Prolixibacteraceae bacterium]